MKRLQLIIGILFCVLTTVNAQYYSVNYDKQTVAAMAGAYNAEAVTEVYYNQQVQSILKHYSAAEVASAGIYASKFLERKALTNLGIWTSSTENYFYRRIYHMVSEKIMPKIWTVAGMMLESPQTALYWGSYLMKICDDTKNLCMQFESVVTNSSLSFSNVAFLQINQEIASILKLSELGNIDFEKLLNDFTKVPANFNKDNLKADVENLYKTGANLASAGTTNLGNALLQSSQFNQLFSGKMSSAMTIAQNYANLFEHFEKNAGGSLLDILGSKDNVAGLFSFANYNITSWMTDYLDGTMGQYYTQRWYIARRDYGSINLCTYDPPSGKDDVINGPHWYRVNTTDDYYYPTSAQLEAALQNSENHAGWSRTRVQQLNKQNDGFNYTITYYWDSWNILRNGNLRQKAYAYHIRVNKTWDNTEVVYEDVYDSYSMDLNTFKAQLNARLSEFNDNEEGYTYYIASDNKNYYQATDEAKLKGCESVTISVTCSDGTTLSSGTTQYKCSDCGGSLNNHSKECAMRTSVSENNLDLSELNQMEQEANSNVIRLQSQISSLEAENKTLIRKIASASVTDAAKYREQYNKNLNSIETLKKELATWQQKQKDIQSAKADAAKDNEVATDDYYRIPAIMNDCKTSFNLTWQDAGSWNGYTFVRKATMPNINGVITFTATLSIVRKPKYFLGIKIHRAILGINWKLTSDYTDTSVVDVLTLDPSKSDKEKADEVNKRISEIAQEYPSCKITTEYAKNAPAETDNTNDTKHLLWSSDRLNIAMEVDSRITKIYADLVSLEKMMHYKRNIVDVLLDIAPRVNEDQGRRLTLVEKCRKRWLRKAAETKHSTGYNGKYEEDDE
ncbi:MAG: hypothetical protein AB7S64_00165 [Bacteroides sp.]|jgi:hypothetical protein